MMEGATGGSFTLGAHRRLLQRVFSYSMYNDNSFSRERLNHCCTLIVSLRSMSCRVAQ